MSSALNLHELIDEPFGPYPEGEILSEAFLQPKRGSLIQLRSVWMVSNKKSTGLDHTEYAATPPANLPPVYFFGVLQISRLEWLSETGLQWLTEELRERDEEVNGVEESGLTLERLYGNRPADGSRISVYIRCEKNLKASYLTMTDYPESLVLRSVIRGTDVKEFYRTYEILSLDTETYAKSRNYLERWRFYALVKELINKTRTPREERTPAWLVEGMIKKHHDSSRFHRQIYVPGYDSDVDEEGYTTRPRHPQHISKSAAYHILAMHAEWFLAFQLWTRDPRHHLVDLSLWYQFCLRAKKAKRAACKAKGPKRGRWGKEHRNKGEKDLENEWRVDLDRHGTVDGGWEDRIRKKCLNMKPKKMSKQVHSEDEMEVDEDVEEDNPEPVFDSDFSVESSPPVSDSEYDEEMPSLEVIRRIPRYICFQPQLLPGRFDWDCPDIACDFNVDLLNMKETTALSNEDFLFLKRKNWTSVYDERVQNLFFQIVHEHYEEHLRRRGVVVIRELDRKRNKRKVRFELWRPEEPEEPRVNTPTVKLEVDV